MSCEIERKWLVNCNTLPKDAKNIIHREVQVIYPSTYPEIRIRRTYNYAEDYTFYCLCAKSSGGLMRDEFEVEVSEKIWNEAIKTFEPAIKDFYEFEHDGHIIEFSNLDNGNLLYVEVEFESVEEAEAYEFPYPDWVVKEVTNENNYKMREYWFNTHCLPSLMEIIDKY